MSDSMYCELRCINYKAFFCYYYDLFSFILTLAAAATEPLLYRRALVTRGGWGRVAADRPAETIKKKTLGETEN